MQPIVVMKLAVLLQCCGSAVWNVAIHIKPDSLFGFFHSPLCFFFAPSLSLNARVILKFDFFIKRVFVVNYQVAAQRGCLINI